MGQRGWRWDPAVFRVAVEWRQQSRLWSQPDLALVPGLLLSSLGQVTDLRKFSFHSCEMEMRLVMALTGSAGCWSVCLMYKSSFTLFSTTALPGSYYYYFCVTKGEN